MLSYRQKRTLLQILPFGIIPAIFSLVLSIVEKGILGDHPVFPSTGNPYEFRLAVPVLTSLFTGLTIGVFEVFYVNRWFQKRAFLEKMAFKSVAYIFAIIIATLIILVTGHSLESGTNPLNPKVWAYVRAFFSDFAFWSIISYFSLAIISSLFYSEFSNNIGQAVSLNFLTGKYHQPIEEERIFMFLDMRSSTTIAEKLGHVRYFKMLREYYVDLSDPIVQHGGEIYQYVGDEVIVSWKVKGEAKNRDCLNCFFAMKASLRKECEKYMTAFGIVPTFKAGIHLGTVTTGEIGVLKKEITFSGDVLNTTARIQGLCNSYQVDLLVSDKLMDVMELEEGFSAKELGEAELRGRAEKIHLFTIEGGSGDE